MDEPGVYFFAVNNDVRTDLLKLQERLEDAYIRTSWSFSQERQCPVLEVYAHGNTVAPYLNVGS